MGNDSSNIENYRVPTHKLVASRSMCNWCFHTLIDALQHPNRSINKKMLKPDFVNDMPDPSIQTPLFVTWENYDKDQSAWQCRGCIGNLSPLPLATDLTEYALISALRDRRFKPIALEELPSLRVAVSLLVDYEDCKDAYDWTIGIHGIFIEFRLDGQRFSGTYLPDVLIGRGWDHAKTISLLVKKAGYNGAITTELLNKIRCTRYQSSKCHVTYAEYVDTKCKGVDPISNTKSTKKSFSFRWLSSSLKNIGAKLYKKEKEY